MRKTCIGVITITFLCLNLFVSPASAAYTSFSETGQAMANNTFNPGLLSKPGPVLPGIQRAVQETFLTRAEFDAAYPGALLEDFEETLVPVNNIGVFSGPLNSSSDNGSYVPGAIMDGISIDVIDGGGSSNDLVVLTAGFLGVPSAVVGPSFFVDDTEIIFSENNVLAVAMDIFSPNGQTDITITVYGPGDVLQDTIVFPADTDGEFFGITADEPITRMVLSTPSGELIDNLSFALATPASIPTLSEWGAIIMMLSLMGIGTMFLRRRQTDGLL